MEMSRVSRFHNFLPHNPGPLTFEVAREGLS